MITMVKRYALLVACILAIALLAVAVYYPFLHNALVFDDQNFFPTLHVYDAAQTPFSFAPRNFPYFTLGFIHVLFNSVEANRIFSLSLHVLTAWVLFALLYVWLRLASNPEPNERRVNKQAAFVAFSGAAWFAISPVAVYGAGYLIQRTILFATFFSLLSLWYFTRAFRENRTLDLIPAALFYSAAVFSKEHAILLPLAAAVFAQLHPVEWRVKVKRIAIYLALCLPAAIAVLISMKYVVATRYEVSGGDVALQIKNLPLIHSALGAWLVSAVIQANLFFDYIKYWLLPDVGTMSADMRIDFTAMWNDAKTFPLVAFFLALPLAGLYLTRRSGHAALFGCGLLYAWLLYMTELSTVRLQEPFVLYRSYLWAPGFVVMALALLHRLRWPIVLGIFVLAMPTVMTSSENRLESLSSEGRVWQDAAAKLRSEAMPGSDRILYNLGLQQLRDKAYLDAIQSFTSSIRQNPKVSQSYYQRGSAHYALHEYGPTMADLDRAIELNGQFGAAHYARGLVFEQFGCFNEARQAYLASRDLGLTVATLKLRALENDLPKQDQTKRAPERRPFCD